MGLLWLGMDYYARVSSADAIVVTKTVDTSGSLCPEPVLQARQALRDLQAGQTIRLVATDPHAELDLEVFCARTGHQLVHQEIKANRLVFWIQKKQP